MHLNFVVRAALFGWIPVVILLFMIFPPRRAVVVAFLMAWLFLPMARYKVSGLPDYTKMSATCFGVFLAASIFDLDRLLSFRPRWVDLPIAVWCLSPFLTSILNDLGPYDGLAQATAKVITWGLPYLIGRVYFFDLEGLRELTVGIVVGGLVYVPLCLFEVRMSPVLHQWIYGFVQTDMSQQWRGGSFRPIVFMQHGLMVAMWMCMTTLVGMWMWWTGALRKILDVPFVLGLGLMLVTCVLCKSSYAMLLLMAGSVALLVSRWMGVKLVMAVMMLTPPAYILLRGSGLVDGQNLIAMSEQIFGTERAGSLATRINAENLLAVRAQERMFFGWGEWGRSRIKDERGGDVAITDSLWIITFGTAGIVGLLALNAMLLQPMYLVMKDYRVEQWSHPAIAPIVALATVSMLYMFDHLMNGMVNPIFMLAVGAVCSSHVTFQMLRQRAMLASQLVRARGPGIPDLAAPAGGLLGRMG